MAFSISVSKKLTRTGFRNTLIEAIKAANPSLNDLNFDDFVFNFNQIDFMGSQIKSKIDSGEEGYQEGMVVKPTVKMTIKNNEDIKRNYTENSYETIFTVNSPDADEFIKKHVHIENLSELTWEDYETVLNELNKFTNGEGRPIEVKRVTENANSKYIYLGYNSGHSAGNVYEDTPSALLSYKLVSSEMDSSFKRVLTFHFTRAEVENKRDLAIENNTLTVGENNMTENHAVRRNDPSDHL